MKKILSLIICLVLICSFSVTAFAAGATASLSGVPSEIKKDVTATITVNVSGSPSMSSALVQVTLGNGLELVSGEWKKDGIMKDFTVSNGYGVIAFSGAGTMDGTVFSFVVKGKTVSQTAQNVKVDLTFKSGSSVVGTASASKTVKVACASHTYGSYTNANATNHTRTCSACGNVETNAHSWNGGSVTKTANCKETGVKTYTCTANGCGATKTETIAKTNSHNWSGYKVTKEPTCTAAGTQTRTCSVCGETESQSVPATGHSYGAWATTKEPTCTEKGVDTRKCSKCSATETKDIAALGHKFSNPTVTKQPTCTETGIESGKCTRCGAETTNTLKATGHNFGSWKNDKDATCTEGGTQKRICSKCGAEETRNTDALGHDFENPTIVKEATISTTGLKEGKCKRCGETTSEVIPCSQKDEATGILFQTEAGIFTEGAQVTVEEIKQGSSVYESVKNILLETSDTFTLYDISAVLNGTEIQPSGEVTVTFNIPEGYGTDVAVYYIADDGSYEKLESTISEDGKTVSAKLTHFSNYAVCKLGKSNSANTDVTSEATEQSTESNNTLWIIIAIVAVVLIAGAVVTVIIIRKKKNNIEE